MSWLRRLPDAKVEIAPLLLLLAVAALLLVFGLVADEVTEGDTRTFDSAVMQALRDPQNRALPVGPPWLREGARDITALGSQAVLTLVTVGTVGFLTLSGARGAAKLVAGAIIGGAGLVQVLKEVFGRVRPEVIPHSLAELTRSFPSGHSTLSAITYLTLGALLARVQPRRVLKVYVLSLAITVTAVIGVTRVYLGLHWPTDVLAGWCLGSSWAMACWVVAERLQRAGQVERTTEG